MSSRNRRYASSSEAQKDADSWKSIGNRHMAAKEYDDAYKAYCTAIQISPLGPSSHIFLSNRAAALLSLKRYSAASIDARRAITLAPTFGKAHARLGQSLYFLKDYAGAVAAYENAFQFEPENEVTWTYLNKAKRKFERDNERRRRREEQRELRSRDDEDDGNDDRNRNHERGRGVGRNRSSEQESDYHGDYNGNGHENGHGNENGHGKGQYEYDDTSDNVNSSGQDDGLSVTDTVDLANMALSKSVTDTAKDLSTSIIASPDENLSARGNDTYETEGESDGDNSNHNRSRYEYNHNPFESSPGRNDRIRLDPLDEGNENENELDEEEDLEDPDFDEALRLQESAARNLLNRQYRVAVEEFSAALFLVPDDDNLTPHLYVGRAHSLNGLERHEGALNDAMMALGRDPELGEAHLVLARTYFYLKDYAEAEQSFQNAIECLDEISPLDQMYLKKSREMSEVASLDFDDSRSQAYSLSRQAISKPVPKLKPPRFVSRKQQLESTQNVPPMPKKWAKQVSRRGAELQLPQTLKVGTERVVQFHSKAMGVKLNRGPDGVVRVLSVASTEDRSDIQRKGEIYVGDIMREAAGVDLRRPLTNVMWSDTVALLKIAPRPLVVKVAMELSEKLPAVQKEFDATRREAEVQEREWNTPRRSMRGRRNPMMSPPSCAGGLESVAKTALVIDEMEDTMKSGKEKVDEIGEILGSTVSEKEEPTASLEIDAEVETNDEIGTKETSKLGLLDEKDSSGAVDYNDSNALPLPSSDGDFTEDEKQSPVATETCEPGAPISSASILNILFPRPGSSSGPTSNMNYSNQSWKAEEETRQLLFCGEISKFEKGRFFWSNDQFVKRTLILYEKPNLLVVAREPQNAGEVRGILRSLDDGDQISKEDDNDPAKNFLIAESVVDLKTCKLRLSELTTPTSIVLDPSDGSPDSENVSNRSIDMKRMSCFEIITPSHNFLISAMKMVETGNEPDTVLSENTRTTYTITSRWEEEISNAILSAHDEVVVEEGKELIWRHMMILGTLHSHVVSGNYSLLEQSLRDKGSPQSPYKRIDERDAAGLTALHYACLRRSNKAVSLLLGAGADCSLPTGNGRTTPCHICAQELDEASLSMILSSAKPKRADPNALDDNLETPMYVALTRGTSPIKGRNPSMCMKSLEAWGGQISLSSEKPQKNPVEILASRWDHHALNVAFDFYKYRYPIMGEVGEGYGRSLGAIYHYPLHSCLVALRKKIAAIVKGGNAKQFSEESKNSLNSTLQIILDHGFEPNERIEGHSMNPPEINEMLGFAPLQILAAAAADLIFVSQKATEQSAKSEVTAASSILCLCAELLVTKGARVWIDAPMKERFNRGPPRKSGSSNGDMDNILRLVDPLEINLEKNKDVMVLLGGTERLAAAVAKWQKERFLKGIAQPFLEGKGLSIQIPDCMLSGGSDQGSCAICWKKFGKIRNRKHICRASRRYVCDECSSKTILLHGDSRRISDGQFNLAKCDINQKMEEDHVKQEEQRKIRKMRIEKAQAARYNINPLRATEQDESAAKEELFGNVGRAVKNFFMEEVEVEDNSSPNANERVTGVMDSLNATRNAFNERGQKLDNLVEKTSALKDASEDFAKMAKELRESQEKGIFGW